MYFGSGVYIVVERCVLIELGTIVNELFQGGHSIIGHSVLCIGG